MSLNELKKKLSIVYHDFLNVFDREKMMQLSLHQSYDHKIELKDKNQFFRMTSSLKREIQRSSFSIFDIKDDTSTSATAQKSFKVSQRIINATTHKKN